MVKMSKQFDSRQVDPSDSFEVIEAGWYTAQLEKSESKITNNKDGSYLELMFKILDGPRKGRVVFTRLNLDNPNPVAVEIAERNLSALCHATGVIVLDNSEQLHNKPLEIKVKYVAAKGKYEASNEVSGYRPLEKTPDFANNSRPEAQTTEQPATSETRQEDPDTAIPDWMRANDDDIPF